MARVTSRMVISSPVLPKTSLNALAYSGSLRTILRIGSWSLRPCSTGLMNGCSAWSSRSGERPSQNWVGEVGGVDHRGRVARAGLLLDALGDLQRRVGEGLVRIVAGEAADLPVGAEPRFVVQLVPEGDLLRRLRVVLRDRHRRQAERAWPAARRYRRRRPPWQTGPMPARTINSVSLHFDSSFVCFLTHLLQMPRS